jgi:hypothetical protein
MSIQQNSDPIALTAQADIHRFYSRVIYPALTEFAPGPDVTGGVAPDLDTFFARAQAHTHNALCWEMRRTFGLTIGAMFERQLRFWLVSHAPKRRAEIEKAVSLAGLEPLIGELRGVTLEGAGSAGAIRELWLVANAVRHGEGRSLRDLVKTVPRFWSHLPENIPEADRALIADMRVKDRDLRRYTLAAMKFWWLAGASSVPGL